jgi:hypothetical protein
VVTPWRNFPGLYDSNLLWDIMRANKNRAQRYSWLFGLHTDDYLHKLTSVEVSVPRCPKSPRPACNDNAHGEHKGVQTPKLARLQDEPQATVMLNLAFFAEIDLTAAARALLMSSCFFTLSTAAKVSATCSVTCLSTLPREAPALSRCHSA